ncbi:glycosyltransferase family protein [Nonlabens marinus]|uniref:Uncharacterized protein n=1 Tax=Nonlabens marinus S1-08 TaxID=1454201 RepID=W8W057_9FLAO|nr:hypothetical protein [Nonlabens marinus]BAO55746.1 hypothetical protein FP1254 [Nonlabens marinus S1-08]
MSNSSKHSTLGLVITDGVGYRNFLLSDFPKAVASSFEKVVLFSGLPASAFEQLDVTRFTIVELPIYRETKRQWFWRKLREIAHLRMFPNNDGIRDNLSMNYRTGWRPNDILVKIIYAWTWINPSEKAVQQFEKYRNNCLNDSPEQTIVDNLLDNYPVDLLFFTHQRPPFIALLTIAAEKRKIPTATFIFSWDNLASKGRMASTFDHYLTWSELMKNDLLYFYKNVSESQVHVVGTPQFEPYVLEEFHRDRNWLLNKFDLDPDKKTICYSCADKSIGPNDPIVIASIAQAIDNKEIEGAQLLVRTSPAEDPDRFKEVKDNYPEIKWNYPRWKLTRENHPEPWSQRIPDREDIAELRSVLEYSDINVNMCSTMSLDFMIFDKPVINTVFGNPENGLYNDQRFLKYQHYKTVIESGAVSIAKNKQELIDQINFSLENPTARLKQQRELVKLQISKPLEGTSKRISTELAKLISR